MDFSGVLVWLAVIGIFLLSIVIMAVLGFIVSSLFHKQEDLKNNFKGGKK
jgi:hypothetical protein